MPITTIFFDLGSTLIHSLEAWPPIYRRADRALGEALNRAGIMLDPALFSDEFTSFIGAYYTGRDQSTTERTAFAALKDMLDGKGFSGIPDSSLRSALEAMYAITQTNWKAEEDAIPTLEALKSRGYRLGMISNTSDDQNVQQLVDRHGFRPYFEYIVTSAALGIRKPDTRIFQVALDHFGVRPESVAMVGDTLTADIEGANYLGIYSIWITRRAEAPDPEFYQELPLPRAIVGALSEIPPLLEGLRA